MTLVNSRKASKVVRTQVVAVNKRTGERCINCSVKTFKSKPKGNFLGAGWEIMNKVLKSGYLIPSIFANFKWEDHQEIRFYSFIPKINLNKYQLSPEARRANYKMFRYVTMDKIPYFVVYKK